ncbi:hypothetical protein [Mycobacterium phage WXIN]|nr:hypothetical protein [Mycobacterium phage WXIN]
MPVSGHPCPANRLLAMEAAQENEARLDAEIAALERELEHASAIALSSVGQPDRAANVAYREEIRAKLAAVQRGDE